MDGGPLGAGRRQNRCGHPTRGRAGDSPVAYAERRAELWPGHDGMNDSVLLLAPHLGGTGGIQASGRLAWDALAATSRPKLGPVGPRSILFCYGRPSGIEDTRSVDTAPGGSGEQPGSVIWARSKPRAVTAALSRRWPVTTVLVWHTSLLKLLPFFGLHGASVALFLHGIESWRRLDWVTNRMLSRVDLLLSNSNYTVGRFIAVNPECSGLPCRIVPLGIACPVTHAPPMPPDPPVALMLSRLLHSEDYKGHRELISAWPLVLQRVPSAELWIVGEGDLRCDLERLAAGLGIGARVRFWGHVSEAHKEHLLARSRCLVMPSRGEGFGLVYLEAMRLGRPCLVSTYDAGREVVNPPEAGLAVAPDKPPELANAICRLLSLSDEWQRWSEQARVRYELHFTAQQFQHRLRDALQPLTVQAVPR